MRMLLILLLLGGCGGRPAVVAEQPAGPAAGAAPTVSIGGNFRGYYGHAW